MHIPYKAVRFSGILVTMGILGRIIGMINRYARVKYKGKVYRVRLSSQDAMTQSFSRAVSNAITSAKQNGNPVARYDRKLQKSYLEYPDGHKVYRDEA